MGQLVSHPGDLAPRYVRSKGSHFRRNLLCRLSYNLESPDDRVNCLVICGELLEAHSCNKLPGLRHGIQHVCQVVLMRPLLLHIDTTSLKILSPIRGFKASSMTRSTLTSKRSE